MITKYLIGIILFVETINPTSISKSENLGLSLCSLSLSLFINLLCLCVFLCMDQFKVSIVIVIIFLFSLYCQLISGHQIELISATSIHPCLDTYDILVNAGSTYQQQQPSNLSQSNNEMVELIRVYTTNDPNLHLRQYFYLKEFKVPFNRLVKISCSFLTPEAKYYCFSYVSMYKVNSSIAVWTQPECKFTLDSFASTSQHQDHQHQPNSYIQSHHENVNTLSANNKSQLLYSEGNNTTIKSNNNTATASTYPSKDYQFAVLSSHGPSYTFISTTHETTSNDFKKSDLNIKKSTYSSLKLVKCRCNHFLTYPLESNGDELINTTLVNHFDHSSQFLLEIFPCSQSSPSDPLCATTNSSTLMARPIGSQLSDTEPLCLVNLTRAKVKLTLQIVKSLSCGAISPKAKRHKRQYAQLQSTDQDGQLPIIRDGLFAIDPQLEITSETINTHQLGSSFLRIETPANRYYLIHVIVYTKVDSSSKNLFSSLIVFFSSFQLIWLTLISLTSFIVLSIFIFLCVYLIVPVRRRLQVQTVLLDDLANTSTSFVEASSLEQFDFDETGSLEMDYYDYGMHPTTKGSIEKLSQSSEFCDHINREETPNPNQAMNAL